MMSGLQLCWGFFGAPKRMACFFFYKFRFFVVFWGCEKDWGDTNSLRLHVKLSRREQGSFSECVFCCFCVSGWVCMFWDKHIIRILRVCVPGTCLFTSCPLSLNNWSQSVRAKQPEPLTEDIWPKINCESHFTETGRCSSTTTWPLQRWLIFPIATSYRVFKFGDQIASWTRSSQASIRCFTLQTQLVLIPSRHKQTKRRYVLETKLSGRTPGCGANLT